MLCCQSLSGLQRFLANTSRLLWGSSSGLLGGNQAKKANCFEVSVLGSHTGPRPAGGWCGGPLQLPRSSLSLIPRVRCPSLLVVWRAGVPGASEQVLVCLRVAPCGVTLCKAFQEKVVRTCSFSLLGVERRVGRPAVLALGLTLRLFMRSRRACLRAIVSVLCLSN